MACHVDIITPNYLVRGFQGAQGYQGAQGFQGVGAQGAQGSQGFQGAQGDQGFQGDQGYQGAQGSYGGPQGYDGAQGPQGNSGSQGPQGADGTQGSQGADGQQGPQGNTGSQGPQGAEGAQGFAGTQGADGQQGPQGTRGYQGSTGAQGSQGFQGAQGAQGNTGGQGTRGYQGFQGSQGADGQQGPQGTRGFTGNQGASGPQGTQGAMGYQGAASTVAGPQGAQGPQGYQGAGFQGAQGAQGPQGYQGAGFQGAQGSQGPQGSYGGPQGAQGSQGASGYQGIDGTQGPQGAQGYQGSQGYQGYQGSQGPIAGTDKQLTFNDNGAAAGSGIEWDKSTKTATIRYDLSNQSTFAVGSDGKLTISAAGTSPDAQLNAGNSFLNLRASDGRLYLQASGMGALNARGIASIDLQTLNNTATRVASGLQAICLGNNNTASGTQSISIGVGNESTAGISLGHAVKSVSAYSLAGGAGAYTWVMGQKAHSGLGPSGWTAFGAGQSQEFLSYEETTGATPKELTGWPGTTTYRLTVLANSSFIISGQIIAQSDSADGRKVKGWTYSAVISRNVNTTRIVGTPVITEIAADAEAATWRFAITADDAYDALTITVTGEAATTIRWTHVARCAQILI
jgi:hypothetical protein